MIANEADLKECTPTLHDTSCILHTHAKSHLHVKLLQAEETTLHQQEEDKGLLGVKMNKIVEESVMMPSPSRQKVSLTLPPGASR